MNAVTPATPAAQTAYAEPDAGLLNTILSRVDAIAVQQSRPSPVQLRTWEEIERFAEKAARSGMVPKDYVNKPDAICIAIQMGSELGLAPMQALQNIAVVNGRPSIWGDAMPALCRASGKVGYIKEWHAGEGDNLTYYCEAVRRDDPNPIRSSFSVADARKAGLWKDSPKVTKQGRDGPYEVDSGPWYSYAPRMLQMRARGFCLRDAFPDVLKGLITREEAADIPFEATGLSIPSQPDPTPQAAPDAALPKPTVTIAQWVAKTLPALLATCETPADLDSLSGRKAVQAAKERGTDEDKAEITRQWLEAEARIAATTNTVENDPNNDVFPGDTPLEG